MSFDDSPGGDLFFLCRHFLRTSIFCVVLGPIFWQRYGYIIKKTTGVPVLPKKTFEKKKALLNAGNCPTVFFKGGQ